jgi:phosphoserine phosphatase
VDLDGTLTPRDSLHHLLRRLALTRPLACWDLPWWALQGRSLFKTIVSDRIALSASDLPYHAEVLRFLARERKEGRALILATAADHRIARAVAGHLGLFSHVIATTRDRNLKGHTKLDAIRTEVGTPFDYMGDSWDDLPIFAAASHSYVVSTSARLINRVERMGITYTVVATLAPSGPNRN